MPTSCVRRLRTGPRQVRGVRSRGAAPMSLRATRPSHCGILYRSPNPNDAGVQGHGELIRQHAVQGTKKPGVGSGRMHRHTGSIASLIRADEQVEPDWKQGFRVAA
jgi:hypothetical protein